MGQFHWHPESYLELMRAEVPAYERLQEAVAEDTTGQDICAILELGTGTGETTRRLLAGHPLAKLLGIDSSEDMLAAARRSLDPARVDLRPHRPSSGRSGQGGPLRSSCGGPPARRPIRNGRRGGSRSSRGLSAAPTWQQGDLAVIAADV